MKPFDLEKALAGEPVKLRNGNKAFVLARIPDTEVKSNGGKVNYPLLGYVCNRDGRYGSTEQWTDNGKFAICDEEHLFNIVEMWQEPRPRVQLDLPAPLKKIPSEQLLVYVIEEQEGKSLIQEKIASLYRNTDVIFFLAKEDAQEWLDAMRNARK